MTAKRYPIKHIRVNTWNFEFTNGRKPRGRGNWAFRLFDTIFWKQGMYSDCLKAAKQCAANQGVTEVVVLP